MDTIDRIHTNLPAPVSANLSLHRDQTPALPVDQAGTPGLQVNPRVILRGLSRHWWRILGCGWWFVPRYGILIHSVDRANLRGIEPAAHRAASARAFHSINRAGESQGSTYLKTEVTVLTSDSVLEPTVANALVVNLPMIKKSVDPKNDLRQKLRVEIIDNTNLIRVAMELPNRDEAITIVQAVIDSYKDEIY